MSEVEYKDLGISTRCGTLCEEVFPLELSIDLGEVLLYLNHNYFSLLTIDPTLFVHRWK